VSRLSGTAVRATRKPVIVLAGEDANDRACLRIVLENLCPEAKGRLVEINSSVRLREAGPARLKERIGTLARLARARARREDAELAGVLVHEDFDRIDGDEYDATRGRVQDALTSALGPAYYALAVEEVEAWLLLFPAAFPATVAAWTVPPVLRNRDTGLIADPKSVITRKVCAAGRRYRESDAATVLGRAAELGLLDQPVGSNRSWLRLRDDIADLCAGRLSRRG
jgi:hypothetical protein